MSIFCTASLDSTADLSCTIFESELFVEIRDFFLPHVYNGAVPLVVTPLEYQQYIWRPKTRVLRLLCGIVCIMFSRFGKNSPTCDVQTDRWMDIH